MNTRTTWIVIAVIVIVLAGAWYFFAHKTAVAPNTGTETSQADEDAVRAVVTHFGTKLQMVSTLAPKEDAAAAIVANYGNDVAPDLLSRWEADPSQAPGRQTSSPWPDRITIGSVAKNPDGSYGVAGNVIEVTSVEAANGGVADSYSINLTVSNVNGSWLITSVETGLQNQ